MQHAPQPEGGVAHLAVDHQEVGGGDEELVAPDALD